MDLITKTNYTADILIKTLYLTGKLMEEQGNFERIPGWIVDTLDINGAALGIISAKQCVVHFSRLYHESENELIKVALENLSCDRQNKLDSKAVPCHILDCPVRQKLLDRCGQPGLEVTCFPMPADKGFLMVCGEALLLNSYPVSEILKAVTHNIYSSLEAANKNRGPASYFLPSENMAQMWSEMLAGLSHDLRTPLSCIKGYITTLLREDVSWEPAAEKEFMNIIVEETEHIENLINNLLDSSTFSWKGEVELKKVTVSIPQLINKVLRDKSYHVKNHHYSVLFPEDFPLVEADPSRIEQVLRNLVDNSVKYSEEETKIVIEGKIMPGEIVVSVSDQGIGLTSEHIKWLFEKFFRVTGGIQENKKGIGLGLPFARQIILSHGGRIWADSILNQGTTLYFTLPLGQQTADHSQDGGQEAQDET
jgi:K+-sensing histidine kinase KdpD